MEIVRDLLDDFSPAMYTTGSIIEVDVGTQFSIDVNKVIVVVSCPEQLKLFAVPVSQPAYPS